MMTLEQMVNADIVRHNRNAARAEVKAQIMSSNVSNADKVTLYGWYINGQICRDDLTALLA